MRNLKADLLRGKVLVGPIVTCPAPAIVELVGYAGFDWVLIDTEQSATSPAGIDLEGMVRAAHAADIAAAVRVCDNSESQINNALNLGAKSVWVPHVESAEEAARAVAAFHYSPKGHRGAAPVVRAAKYGIEDWDTYRHRADQENLLVAIIESRRGLQNVDSIAAVPGLDALCFGPFDMAVDLGLESADFYGPQTKRWIHPALEDAGNRVLEATRRHGKIPVAAAWDAKVAREWITRGYRMMLFGLDMAVFGRALLALKASLNLSESV